MNDYNESIVKGEFFKHEENSDGTRDLFSGKAGLKDHDHAVFDSTGNLKFLREDGFIKADDSL